MVVKPGFCRRCYYLTASAMSMPMMSSDIITVVTHLTNRGWICLLRPLKKIKSTTANKMSDVSFELSNGIYLRYILIMRHILTQFDIHIKFLNQHFPTRTNIHIDEISIYRYH